MTVDLDRVGTPHGMVALVRLARPEVRNALDTATLTRLVDTLHDLAGDVTIRGLVLTGAGASFCAGADLAETSDDGGRRRMELFTTVLEQLVDLGLPSAAAIRGDAIGGGAELAGACDVRLAAPEARLRFPGAIHGVPVGVARTVGQVGLSVAKDWVLSARDVSAEEAERRGFLQHLVPEDRVVDAAIEWVAQTASRDPDTVALLRRLFDQQSGHRDRVMFENDVLRAQAELGALPDFDRDLPRTIRPRRV